ncbi:PREDICTED: uncharacterized protein LOC104596812 [Nelumbo nucifera]|uniref:Uncharacterized protein n=2 Tax=Nelumbo nucifera TaxID=4432 RepID=A0A822Z331_NELNU|nr:PREDICTED: uncharacterized protein LOC104596812 [Nelumbo nucifera]DAD39187.1 TPA_asm: hypothetical protein HUJ06_013510 [Nelumbo nucifera]
MDSAPVSTGQAENILQTEGDTTPSPTTKRPSSRRRSPSLSSSSSFRSFSSSVSSSSSSNPDDLLSSPAPSSLHFSGIPFSWEKHPGIPKNSTIPRTLSSKYKDGSLFLLPLPPAGTPIPAKRFNFDAIFSIRKKNSHDSLRRDPFIAALMECSKDQEGDDDCWKNTKVSRTLIDRFGFIDLYASCKRSCAVAESKVLLPRSSRAAYDLLNRRSG